MARVFLLALALFGLGVLQDVYAQRYKPCPEKFQCAGGCCQTGDCVYNETAKNYTCDCSIGWTGEWCDRQTCHGGNRSEVHQDTPPYTWDVCTCGDDWEGTNCLVPVDPAACGGENETWVVDTSFNLHGVIKASTCNITGDWGQLLPEGKMSFQCWDLTTVSDKPSGPPPPPPSGENPRCLLQAYELHKNWQMSAMVNLFVVEVSKCVSYLGGKSKVLIDCEETKAMCSNRATFNLCADYFAGILASFQTRTYFECDVDAGDDGYRNCEMHQTDAQNVIPMLCRSGDCLSHEEPPPKPPKQHLPPILIAGIVFAAVAAVAVAIFVVVQLYRRRSAVNSNRDDAASPLLPGGSPVFGDREATTPGARESLGKLDARSINEFMTTCPVSLTFSDVSFTLKPKTLFNTGERKTVLSGVSGGVAAGQVLAIMGCSGAGKTTLLDVLAGRKKSGDVTGQIWVNGVQVDGSSFKTFTGYVLQEDPLMATMTVREAVAFSALLRLPSSIPAREKHRMVDQTLSDLGIAHVANSRIGSPDSRGISGGERRRVSIACELVTSPSILFLDEPTSGLDSHTALAVMRTLVGLARRGHTIVCSIHQPSSQIVRLFDKLVLLRDGVAVYSGQADRVLEFFEGAGHSCDARTNPADFFVELANEASISQLHDFRQMLNTSYYAYNPDLEDAGGVAAAVPNQRRGVGWLRQCYLLCKRTFKNAIRDPLLFRAHMVIMILVGILVGVIYYKLGNDLVNVQNRVGVFFFICALFSFASMTALELFIKERTVFVFERANGYYHTFPYFVAKVLYDVIPLRVIPPMVFSAIVYPMVGLVGDYEHFANFLIAIVLYNCVCSAMCLCIGTAIRSFSVANLVASLIILFSMLFGGFLLNKSNIPHYLDFLNYSSAFAYAFEILMVNELHGFIMNFNPPKYPAILLDADIILQQFGLKAENFNRDFVVLGVMLSGFLVLAYLILHFFVKENR